MNNGWTSITPSISNLSDLKTKINLTESYSKKIQQFCDFTDINI